MIKLTQLLNKFAETRIVVVGDVMLDEYAWGEVERISPEAPVPVVSITERSFRPGGAANVAANIAALGGRVVLSGVCGDDYHGAVLRKNLAEARIDDALIADRERPTTTKTRVLSQGHHIARIDREQRGALGADLEAALLERITRELSSADIVVLSDYAKGVLTPGFTRHMIDASRALGKRVLADPKDLDFRKYLGCSVITPNAREALSAVGQRSGDAPDWAAVGAELLRRMPGAAVLITRGESGMILFEADSEPVHIRAARRQVFEVTGAGDTVIGVLALALGAGAPLADSARLANYAAGLVVAKVGTATVSAEELSKYPD